MSKKKIEIEIMPQALERVLAASTGGDYILTNYIAPKNVKRLNLPRLVKCAEVPVGGTVAGELLGVIDNFTGKEDMKNSKVLHMKTPSEKEFLFPMTGGIRKALSFDEKGKACDATHYIGRELFLTREADQMSGKYKKTMFCFDVFVAGS